MHTQSKLITALLLVGASTFACTETDSGEAPRTVSGQLSPEHASSRAQAGSTGTTRFANAYRVEASGSLTLVESSALVGDDYVLELYSSPGEDFIITIDDPSEGRLGSVLLESNSAIELEAAPADAETTFEADTLIELKRSSLWDDATMSQAYVRAQIDAETAAVATASSNYEAETRHTSEALAESMLAFQTRLSYEAGSETRSNMSSAHDTLIDAQQRFDTKISQASQASIQAADDAFVSAFMDAYIDAGFSAEAIAEAQVAATATLKAHSASTLAASKRSVDIFEAGLTARAIEARMIAAGAEDRAITSAIDARTDLIVAISAAHATGIETQAAVNQAWNDYRAWIQAELQSGTSLSTTVLTSLVTQANEAAALFDAATASADAETVVDAMVDARGAVVSDANIDLLTLTGDSNTEAEATLEIIALLAFTS